VPSESKTLTRSRTYRAVDDPLFGLLDSDSGHGTFIAGPHPADLPDAGHPLDPDMASDGAVCRSELLTALNLLALRQSVAQADGDLTSVVDILTCRWATTTSRRRLTFDPEILQPLGYWASAVWRSLCGWERLDGSSYVPRRIYVRIREASSTRRLWLRTPDQCGCPTTPMERGDDVQQRRAVGRVPSDGAALVSTFP